MKIKLISSILLLALLTGAFASCNSPDSPDTETEGTTVIEQTSTNEESATSTTEKESSTVATETESTTDGETIATETEATTEEDTSARLEGEYAALIENADRLKNKVNASYDASRRHYTVENGSMVYKYDLSTTDSLAATVTNKNGSAYVQDTMDVFVKMSGGKTYYASNSYASVYTNIFRYGYYYYDVHLYDQSFYNDFEIVKEQSIDLSLMKSTNELKRVTYTDGIIKATVGGTTDPYVSGSVSFDTADCNAVRITMKANGTTGNVYFKAGANKGYSSSQMATFQIQSDGEFHTYIVPLDAKLTDSKGDNGYTGMLSALRIDINGARIGETLEISEVTALKLDNSGAPEIVMDRNLNMYSDKLHQVIRLIAKSDVSGIDEVGMITKIDADKVEKLIVKDKNGTVASLDSVDWNSAEYVAFDIKDAGIFGYILPVHENSGSLKVSLDGDTYVITQTTKPEGGVIKAIVPETKYGSSAVASYVDSSTDPYTSENDFIFAQRIYTDNGHSFESFLNEAECERHPLTSENIKINEEKSPDTSFDGYDPLRGIYCFTLEENTTFGRAMHAHPNLHCKLSFSVTGDERERNIYVLAYTYTTGLECSAVLDKNDMMLPVPVEVSKNFYHEFEEPIYSWGDIQYSEARIPMKINAGETTELSILHLYMNWGQFPLKQLSSIQFGSPYYHLSTGVTETNCISNMYTGVYNIKNHQLLPDHRAMSAPAWDGGTQHTAGGYHHFLYYTDSDGRTYSSESVKNVIKSAGPTYADIDLTYLSDDSKIKATYSHVELPQLDENRAFYTMTYEVLEDVSFDNFTDDFAFYSVSGYVNYEKIGYLDENNESQIVNANLSNEYKYYKLGDNCPYFDMFKCANSKDYVNVSFLIQSAEFIIGGEKVSPAFVVTERDRKCRLTLDLGKVTLKKGDTFTIKAVIMPWGSQETDYESDAPDLNVRQVRENTLLDPLTVTGINSGTEVIDSFGLPKIIALNGKRAEFTLTGGENNVVFRVYGFEKLTVPKLYERIDGAWQLLDISSLNYPDSEGNAHPYDGYAVHYDGDGTYSYSFVVNMDGDARRTFSVDAGEEFSEWPEAIARPDPEPTDIYLTPTELMLCGGSKASQTGNRELAENNEYLRIYGNEKFPEQYISLDIGDNAKGQYAVVKYRVPETNDSDINFFQFYAGTKSEKLVGEKDSFVIGTIRKDSNWNVMVVDIASYHLGEFVADEDGGYSPKYLRFDPFNSVMSETSYIDIAYIALCESIDEVISFNTDMLYLTLVSNGNENGLIKTVPEDTCPPEAELFDLFISADDLYGTQMTGVGKMSLMEEDGKAYVRYYGDGKSAEGYGTIYKDGKSVTGQYYVLKYRVPTTNAENMEEFFMQYFTSTVNSGAKGPGDQSDFTTNGAESIIKDGEWHILVLDISKEPHCKTFPPAEDGTYSAKFIRLDVINGPVLSVNSYVDVAFVGTCSDLAGIEELLED